MSTFSIDLARFGQRALDNSEKIIRKISFDIHARIVYRMPVDKGWARANTCISLNTLPSNTVPRTDKSGKATINAAKGVMRGFTLGDTIFLYNNVEYIIPLEYGSSRQAPQGMFRISFNEIAQHLGAV